MIPISPDVKKLVGDWAEFVDNRSLLYEKFCLPKVWGQDRKLDDAGRWSVLRIVTRGKELLLDDANNLKRRASGHNVQPQNAERMLREALIARKMANITQADPDLVKSANANARQLLQNLESSYSEHIVTFEATLAGRLMVNMAGSVIENAGICLDRCFGLPFIPGSAVKGIARSQALWEIKEAAPAEKRNFLKLAMAIFGYGKTDTGNKGDWTWAAGHELVAEVTAALQAAEFKGCACFLPAYPTTPPTLVVDMVNPHYPEYYRGRRDRATDDENPIPNYFPAVEAGSAFGFAVLLNRVPAGFTGPQLLDAARGWIERAITQKGLGAKTAAGYGWFQLGAPVVPASQPGDAPSPKATAPITVNEATLKNYVSALTNPGSRDGKLAGVKADLARDATFGPRLAAALTKLGKDGKKAIEWLKTKGVNLT
jgi:CRISPR type III-B/RAMP module RAMP protein Cmr6